jgi:type VI secretion system Hcp family effector
MRCADKSRRGLSVIDTPAVRFLYAESSLFWGIGKGRRLEYFWKNISTMRTIHPSMLTCLCLTFALTVGTFARAQDRSELNISNSIVEASSVMQITRSNIGQYTNGSPHLTLTKKADAASPQLLQAHTTNAVIPRLSLTLYKPGDHSKSKVITMENVKILSFSGGQATPVQNAKGAKGKGNATSEPSENETFSFTYQKISVTYFSSGSTSTADDWNANND